MLFFWAFLDFQIFWVFWGLRAFQLFEPLLALIVWNFQTFLESFYQKYFRGNWNYLAWKIWIPIRARCLKITEKVLFNIASEAACYAYILNGQKLSNKKRQKSPFGRVFENLKLAVIQCYQTGQFYKDKNWWKMSKFKNSNATFWVIFKQCAFMRLFFSVFCFIHQQEQDIIFVICEMRRWTRARFCDPKKHLVGQQLNSNFFFFFGPVFLLMYN